MDKVYYYIKCLRDYGEVNRRARRSEFWYFILISSIISCVLDYINGWICNMYSLATLIPFIAVSVRRMHDVDKKGWYAWIPLYSLYLNCKEGTRGMNQYGEDPKAY